MRKKVLVVEDDPVLTRVLRDMLPEDRAEYSAIVAANPRNHIAQDPINLSRSPTWCDGKLEGRHIDLRPFVLSGRDVQMVAGGLTRVALQEGSLVVNSSQGGGTKDTWVLQEEEGSTPC